MEDNYPSVLTWVLRAVSVGLASFAVLALTPAGRDLPNRGSAFGVFLIFAALAWGTGQLTQGSRSQDQLREANRAVYAAQADFEEADRAYQAALVARATKAAAGGDVASSAESMSFEQCLSRIRAMSSSLGPPINLVETDLVRTVRFPASDGSVLVTCSRPDRKMILTRSRRR